MATKKLSAGQLKEKDFEEISRAFITKVYRRMTLALVISGFTA
jgi:FtsH-binding integral membrane protein